mgnify:CR=1 FL=1
MFCSAIGFLGESEEPKGKLVCKEFLIQAMYICNLVLVNKFRVSVFAFL